MERLGSLQKASLVLGLEITTCRGMEFTLQVGYLGSTTAGHQGEAVRKTAAVYFQLKLGHPSPLLQEAVNHCFSFSAVFGFQFQQVKIL